MIGKYVAVLNSLQSERLIQLLQKRNNKTVAKFLYLVLDADTFEIRLVEGDMENDFGAPSLPVVMVDHVDKELTPLN